MRRLLAWAVTCVVAFAACGPYDAAVGELDEIEKEPFSAATEGLTTATLRLQPSANGHYLQKSDGTPFFYLADTAWFLPARVSKADMDLYLTNRAAKGFSVVQIGIGVKHTKNFYGAAPFKVEGDLRSANDAYFQTVDYFIASARAKGLYVAMSVFFGPSSWISNAQEAFDYGKWIGTRYRTAPNMIWILGEDAKPNHPNENYVFYWSEMARGIATGVNDGVNADYRKCVMTFHYNSSPWYHGSTWQNVNGIYTYTRASTIPGLTRADYALQPAKPTVQNEPEYEYPPNESTKWDYNDFPFTSPDFNRRQAYWTYLSGGAGYTFGNGPIFRATPDRWKGAMNWAGSVHMAKLKTIFTARQWWKLVPDQTIATSTTSASSTIITSARSSDGNLVMVYVPVQVKYGGPITPRAVTVDMGKITASSNVAAKWVNPVDASVTSIGTFSNSGARSFTTPSGWKDALLILDTGNGSQPPPTEAILGNDNSGILRDTLRNYIVFFRFTPSSNLNLKQMKVDLARGSSSSADKLKMAIYADKGGYPGALLRTTVEGAALSSTGWNALNLTSPLSVSSGTHYWLAIWANTKAYVVKGDAGDAGLNKYISSTYQANWPNPMTGGSTNWGMTYSIYAQ